MLTLAPVGGSKARKVGKCSPLANVGLVPAGAYLKTCRAHHPRRKETISPLSGLLFGISATDPGILAGAMFLLSSVALAANYLSARRAMRVAPRIALSCE